MRSWKQLFEIIHVFFCTLLLAAVLSGCGRMPQQKSAVNEQTSKTEKALSSYRDILSSAPAIEGEHTELADASFGYDQNLKMFGNHIDRFVIYDIDRDEIPELIAMSTVNFRWTPLSVYTCSNGEPVLLKDPLDAAAHGTFEQNSTANGAYITYICAENHIHNVWRGNTPIGDMEENHAYILEGTSLTETECAVGENEHTVYFSEIAKVNNSENLNTMLQ